jgi:hypothetical protein
VHGAAAIGLADLLVDVGRRTVTRGPSDIRLSKLLFELLRTLIEAAPNEHRASLPYRTSTSVPARSFSGYAA